MTSTFMTEALMGLVMFLLSLGGYFIKGLKSKVEYLSEEIHRRPTDEELRLVVRDHLEPTKVEFRALTRRMDELYVNQKDLFNKMDRIEQAMLKLVELQQNANRQR